MSLESRLDKLEQAAKPETPACAHVIPIIHDGEETPASACQNPECAGPHIVIAIVRPNTPTADACQD